MKIQHICLFLLLVSTIKSSIFMKNTKVIQGFFDGKKTETHWRDEIEELGKTFLFFYVPK